jgi:hypothetical protein
MQQQKLRETARPTCGASSDARVGTCRRGAGAKQWDRLTRVSKLACGQHDQSHRSHQQPWHAPETPTLAKGALLNRML